MTVPRPPSDPDTQNMISSAPAPEAEAATLPPSPQDPAVTVGQLSLPSGADSPSGRASVPGYEIVEELGRGGMGVVYKARQIKLNRLVALKMILSGAHAGAADLERFRTEAEAIARLHHPHVVQVYEIGEHDGRPFFSLEFCEGGTLEKKLAGDPLPPREAAALLETLAHAVAAAHRSDVIHRDLKPSNILLTEDGTAKITDFGLAKRITAGNGLTQTGAIIGTPSYMAPEQAEAKKEVGPAADIYALGAILYECLTGRPPFKAATPLDTVLQVVSEEPVPPARLNAKIPRDLETICLECLHKDPRKRYANADALAEDLARFQRGETIAARPAGRAERAWRWCRRNPSRAAAIVLTALVLLAAVVVPALFALSQRQHAQGLAAEQHKTLQALDESRESTRRAREAQRDALRQAAVSTLERALQICEHGEAGRGLLWLARGLAIAEQADAPELVDAYRWNLGAWSRQVHSLEQVMLHPDEVYAAVWSPDGKTIATGCNDGKVRLWHSTTGQPSGVELTHPSAVLSLAYRRDGQHLAACCRDGTIHVWDLASGRETTTFRYQPWKCPDWMFPGVAFSPDGATLLTGGQGTSAHLWDATTGKSLERTFRHSNGPSDYAEAIAFSPDGTRVLIGNNLWGINLWETGSGQPLGPQMRAGGRVLCAAFSADGKAVMAGDLPGGTPVGGAQVWDAATRKPIGPRLLHAGAVRAIGFRPDGQRVVTGSEDYTARLWNPVTGEPDGAPLFHGGTVYAASFRPDGLALLTASADRTVRVWRPGRGMLRREISLISPKPPWVIHRDIVHSLAFSPDSRRLATAAGSNPLILWDLATGEPDGPPLPHLSEGIFDVVFRHDGEALFTSTNSGRLRCWNLTTHRAVWQAQDNDEVWRLELSPDGTILAGGTVDYKQPPDSRHGRLWDAATGKPVGAILTHAGKTYGLAFTPDSKTVLTGSTDHTCRLWDARTGQPVSKPIRQANEIWTVALSPDGRTALTAGADRVAQCWSLPDWKAVGPALRHEGMINRVLFTPDGRFILTASQDKTARLWHPATGQPIGQPMRHSEGVIALAVSRDGRSVATGGADSMARVWNMPVPLTAPADEVRGMVEAMTGMGLDDKGGIHPLATEVWRTWRERYPTPLLPQSVPVPQPPVAVVPPPPPIKPAPPVVTLMPAARRRNATVQEIADWIKDLDGEQATTVAKALAETGPAALDALQAAQPGASAAVARNLQAIIERIHLDMALALRRVRLKFDNTPLAEAVRMLSERTGLPLHYGGTSTRTVKLALDDVSLWEAVDQFCDKAGLIYGIGSYNQTLLLRDGPPLPRKAIAYAGPLRLQAVNLVAMRDISLMHRSLPHYDRLLLNMDVRSDNFAILAVGTPVLSIAEDDSGKSLLSPASPNNYFEPISFAAGAQRKYLTFKPATKPGGTLKIVRGTMPVEVLVERKDRAMLDLSKPRPSVPINEGGRVTVESVQTQPGFVSIRLLLSTRGLWRYNALHYQFELIDAIGRRYRPSYSRLYATPRRFEPEDLMLLSGAGQVPWPALALHAQLQRPGTMFMGQLQFAGVPSLDRGSKLVFFSYGRRQTTLPFEFRNLPLP
ncbi:MAG TPA: protein kinase [Gemmataceae bacterium]|nr:protein kinase [Gemmataceae bacterium]